MILNPETFLEFICLYMKCRPWYWIGWWYLWSTKIHSREHFSLLYWSPGLPLIVFFFLLLSKDLHSLWHILIHRRWCTLAIDKHCERYKPHTLYLCFQNNDWGQRHSSEESKRTLQIHLFYVPFQQMVEFRLNNRKLYWR